MTQPINIVGIRFGRLLVIERADNNSFGHSQWVVKCDCGAELICGGSKLKAGKTKSCGCLAVDTTRARSTIHGHAARRNQSRAYRAWKEMRRRVKRDPSYTSRGIRICKKWENFESFYSDMGECPDKYELDRIDNKKGYTPTNCRWASETVQARNRRYCKINEQIAEKIRKSSVSTRALMVEYKVSKSTINKIKRRAAWV